MGLVFTEGKHKKRKKHKDKQVFIYFSGGCLILVKELGSK